MNYLKALSEIFAQDKYSAAFLIILIIFVSLLTITSGFFVITTMEFNPIADPIKVFLVLTSAFLLALNSVVILHNYDQRKTAAKGTTGLGALAALFTTSCSVCQPFWLLWLGLGSGTAFLTDISIYISLLSILFLLISLHYSLKSNNKCEVKTYGKNA